jgi:geranylgeranyl pyrophosphate synthase
MPANDMDVLRDPITNTDLARVEAAINEVVAVNYPVMTDLLQGIIAAKGKMLRPRIVLTAARLFDYDLDRLAPAAAGLELLHIASLIHDDTVDKALFRRGAATLNSVLPTTIVVLLGDYLFAQSAVLVSRSNNLRAMTRFAETLGEICNGELDEIFQTRQWNQTRAQYDQRINGKTAALFATAAEFGGLLSNAPEPAVQALRSYGTQIGMGFQIVDDVLDLRETAESLGKPAGSDLRQGTLTLPMMLYMERYADAGDLDLIRKIVVGTKTDDAQVDALVGRVRTSGALDDAIVEAQAAVDRAKRELDALPAGEPRDYLAAMADFVTARRS